jgi:RNA polymerase sigma-70 factor (ECF subfamily)
MLVRLKAAQSVEERQRDIYNSHQHRIFALAFYMTGNELEAEQVLTKSFLHAFSACPEPNGQIIDNALLAGLQKRMCFQTRGESVKPNPADSLAQSNVRRTDMEEALKDLPPVERIICLLRDVEGYGVDRISDLVNLPSKEVLTLLFSGRLRLRQRLAEIAAERQEAA